MLQKWLKTNTEFKQDYTGRGMIDDWEGVYMYICVCR
jgi:hypothetical protein